MSGLVVTPLGPQAVVRVRRVECPGALLEPGGVATLRSDLGDAEVVLDFGRERVGYVCLATAGTTGGPLEIRYGETLAELDADRALELPWYLFPRDTHVVPRGRGERRSAGRRAFRYLALRSPGGTGRVEVSDVVVHHQRAAIERTGHFSSSDTRLNRIWDISAYTTELCMQSYYEDGVKRDGLLWIGDARVQFLCGYHAFGEVALARKSLRMIAASQRDDGALPSCAVRGGGHQHPAIIDYMPGVTDGVGRWIIDNYITDYLSALREYHDHTGDLETVRDLWPSAGRAAEYLARLPLDPPVDTGIITDENPLTPNSWWASPGTYLLQYRAALRDLGHCARALGDTERDAVCARRIRDLDEILTRSYRSPGGHYLDRPAPAGKPSWHAAAFGVHSGAAGADGGDLFGAMSGETDAPYPIAGFMKHWVLAALMESGHLDRGLEQIREYWGFMLDNDATTCWEKLDLKRPERVLTNPLVSRCHGWTASPCVLFPRYLLGVSPLTPGYATVTLRPWLPDGVTWMEGTIPTPRGRIFARWEQTDLGLRGVVTLPEGVTGRALVAGGRVVALEPGVTLL